MLPNNKKNREKACILLVNTFALLALLIVVLPHLMLAPYNYASGDDWSYGTKVYHAMQSGGGAKAYYGSVWETVTEFYRKWEPRWSNALFAALSPGNMKEEYYHLNTWIFLAALIFSQLYFIPTILGLSTQANKYMRPVTICMLILEILYVPYPTDSFYWWTGSVNYTFAFSLALFYCGLLADLIFRPMGKADRFFHTFFAMLIGTLIAANNFFVNIPMLMVSCSAVVATLFLSFCGKEKKEKHLWHILSVVLPVICFLISFIMVMKAPSLQTQLDTRAGGEASNSLIYAIFISLKLSFQQIFIQWMDLKVVFLLLLALPFGVVAAWKSSSNYRLPGLVSLFSFGFFASMISVEIYVNGAIHSTYGIDIWYYAYYLFLIINEVYWIGWLLRKQKINTWVRKMIAKPIALPALLWSVVLACLMAGYIYKKDLKSLSSYQAYNYENNGWAKQYGAEWEARLAILHDSTISNPVFEPISLYGGYVTMYDFYEDDNIAYWINEAAAEYYDKESIHLK